MLKDIVLKNRSYRRFHQNTTIPVDTLKELVELARCSPSAANLQPLKYILSSDPGKNELIFPTLGWAGYLTDWSGPAEGERPAAYIIILGDKEISTPIKCDHGIAAQSILLGAAESGLGGCMIGSIKKKELQEKLDIPSRYEILLVLALGEPAEEVVLEALDPTGDIRYWRDDQSIHHVPKRSLEEIILT
jgi:nitroreductase